MSVIYCHPLVFLHSLQTVRVDVCPHARRVFTKLVGRLRPIPPSAGTLQLCSSCWAHAQPDDTRHPCISGGACNGDEGSEILIMEVGTVLTAVTWGVLLLIFAPYFLSHVAIACLCTPRDLRKTYDAKWAVVTGASSGTLSGLLGRAA